MRILSMLCLTLTMAVVSQPSSGEEATVKSKAPSFTLTDQHGKQRSLEDLLKDNNVAVVFHRSANW